VEETDSRKRVGGGLRRNRTIEPVSDDCIISACQAAGTRAWTH